MSRILLFTQWIQDTIFQLWKTVFSLTAWIQQATEIVVTSRDVSSSNDSQSVCWISRLIHFSSQYFNYSIVSNEIPFLDLPEATV